MIDLMHILRYTRSYNLSAEMQFRSGSGSGNGERYTPTFLNI